MKNDKSDVLKRIISKGETMETLTKRGRGVELEQMCSDIGVSEYGTAKVKAVRILKWVEKQAK